MNFITVLEIIAVLNILALIITAWSPNPTSPRAMRVVSVSTIVGTLLLVYIVLVFPNNVDASVIQLLPR